MLKSGMSAPLYDFLSRSNLNRISRFLSSSSSVALQSFGVSWLPAKEADAGAYLSEISKGDQRVGGKKAR